MTASARRLDRQPGLLDGLAGDGRPLVAAGALAFLASGLFLVLLGASAAFLPHDLAFVGLTGHEIGVIADQRVVAFMVHDRVAFGGALIAAAILHLWLVRFGLAERPALAWLTLAASAGAGFVSFLAFLGFGYLDAWHSVATILVLALYAMGLWRLRVALHGLRARDILAGRPGSGRLLLVIAAVGLAGGGLAVLAVGATEVFVPSDMTFIGHEAAVLAALDPELVPLIAHDRASFGGAVLSTGLATLGVAAWMPPSRSRTQVLALAGLAGFGAALGIHVAVGYLDVVHLAPAVAGAAVYAVGLAVEG